MIVMHLNKATSTSEQEHRSELRIGARPDNQLISVPAVSHGLNRHAGKSICISYSQCGLPDLAPGLANRGVVANIQLYPCEVALMPDRFRVELQDNGITNTGR